MGIEVIADVQISISQAATAQENFNRALILGQSAACPTLQLFASLAAVGQVFAPTDPEYLAAQAIFEQAPAPADLLIGKMEQTAGDNDPAKTLNDIILSGDLGKSWYGVLLDVPDQTDTVAVATWVESNKRIHVATSNEADALTADVDDTGSVLKAAGRLRSLYQYCGTPADHADAALMGFALAHEPGTVAMANKTLAGVHPDGLTDGQIGYLDGKNSNYYVSIAGAGRERVGRMANGQWLDVVMGVDWIQSDMTLNIFNVISTLPKIPFTDAGIALIVNQMRLTLDTAKAKGIVDSYEILVPTAASFTQSQKQTRIADGITFTAVLSGSIQKSVVTGVVTA